MPPDLSRQGSRRNAARRRAPPPEPHAPCAPGRCRECRRSWFRIPDTWIAGALRAPACRRTRRRPSLPGEPGECWRLWQTGCDAPARRAATTAASTFSTLCAPLRGIPPKRMMLSVGASLLGRYTTEPCSSHAPCETECSTENQWTLAIDREAAAAERTLSALSTT